MSALQRQKVVIIGCGNVAWHFAKKLQASKKFTLEVYNHRKNEALDDFKKQLNCKTIVGLHNISDDAAFYLVCVSDTYISESARFIKAKNPRALLIHTSGSAEIKELGQRIHSTGVIYPLQTFSREMEVNWQEIPLLCESDEQSAGQLTEFALLLGDQIVNVEAGERLRIHLAAVFVSNFTNAMYAAAADILNGSKSAKTGFTILKPLIEYSTEKSLQMGAVQAQTGPAKRNDKVVMKKHLSLLSKERELQKIYKTISKLIIRQQKKGYAEFQGKAE